MSCNTCCRYCDIQFDLFDFRKKYPDFENIKDEQLTNYWDMAKLILDKWQFKCKTEEYRALLYLLVAHFATLQMRGTAVGIMSSATEGSVSVGWQLPPVTAKNWWYMQTPYGSTFWEMTKRYRTGGLYFAYNNSHNY